MKNPVHPGEILREEVLADLGLTVGEALQSAHDLAAERAAGLPAVRRLDVAA